MTDVEKNFTQGTTVVKRYDDDVMINDLTRQYDTDGDGNFSTKEIKHIVHDILDGERKRQSLRRMLIASVVALVVLLLSIFGMSWAVATLTRKLETNGGMLVDSNTGNPVRTVSTGEEHVFVMQTDEETNLQYTCADPHEVGRMWNTTMAGTPTTGVLVTTTTNTENDEEEDDDESSEGLLFGPAGSTWNRSHACFVSTSITFCFDFESDACTSTAQRRRLVRSDNSIAEGLQRSRRAAFKAGIKGRRRVSSAEFPGTRHRKIL